MTWYDVMVPPCDVASEVPLTRRRRQKLALGGKRKETVSVRLREIARDSNSESADKEEHVVID